ncbi:MAG: serine/threonine protein kinase [Bacteroidales bacterium]|nr:serine/threonine protein kinase [Bacteroidales bacterium]
MHLRENTLLQGGKYRIVRFISSGGFGCTYEAEHVMLGERVAIKEFFVKDFCNRDEATAHVTVGTQSKKGLVDKLKHKFVEEAKMLYRMQHSGIVRVFDIFEENDTAYFVMDYINGPSLSEIVNKEGPLNEARAIKYIRQIAEALKYVHERDRLHLDIKPGNIMINQEDQAILIDFGASKQYDEQDGENTSTLLGTTPGYAPLEQMGNDVVKFMPATDIYALGATLYKLLTGITPLSANLLASGEELEPLPENISEATRKAVEEAMRTNKKKRPQTIDDFLLLLRDDSSKPQSIEVQLTKTTLTADEESTLIIGNEQFSNHTVDAVRQTINGHKYVDLGLSVKWATCNIGAKSPEGIGTLLDWNSRHVEIPKWGGTWRIPTKEEQDELRQKCRFELSSENGIKGYRVIAGNGNSIFLPFTGFNMFDQGIMSADKGYYWSETLHKFNHGTAYFLFLNNDSIDWRNSNLHYAMAIRPVCD